MNKVLDDGIKNNQEIDFFNYIFLLKFYYINFNIMPLTQDPSQIKEVNTPWLPEVPWIWEKSADITLTTSWVSRKVNNLQINYLRWDALAIYNTCAKFYESQELEDLVSILLNWKVNKWEKLLLAVRKKYWYEDFLKLPFLKAIVELWNTNEIKDKSQKAEFFLFMYKEEKPMMFIIGKGRHLHFSEWDQKLFWEYILRDLCKIKL